jgi:hypothetical protein
MCDDVPLQSLTESLRLLCVISLLNYHPVIFTIAAPSRTVESSARQPQTRGPFALPS